MSKPTKASWDDYVADNIRCPDPIGYLEATQNIVEDLKSFLSNAESACDLQQKITEYIAERHEFTEFGYRYMESGEFLKHVDADERQHYSLHLLKPSMP